MVEIQAKIDADRRKLAETKDMAEEERDKVKQDLEAKENELKKAHDEQAQLSTKLQVNLPVHSILTTLSANLLFVFLLVKVKHATILIF